MALKIVSADEVIQIDFITLGIYALPGLGKTTLAFTSESPLLLDFDRGAHRAKNRKDSVSITTWSDVSEMTREDLAPYKTILVDTVGRCLDVLSADIIAKNPKHGNGGSLSLQGFGALKSRFTAWLKLMRTYGKDVVLISHMDEKMEGDILKERLDVQGGSKAEIYKSVDAMAKLYIDGKDRKLDFSPREGSLGKNPAQFDVLTVPSPTVDGKFLGNLLAQIKANINAQTAKQTALQQGVEGWRVKIEALDTQDGFNALLAEVVHEVPEVRGMLNAAAVAHGLVFDKKAAAFVEAQ